MNVLKPTLQSTVKTLLHNEISQREINRKTGIDRKTIRRYARSYESKAAEETEVSKSPTPATGSGGPTDQNPPPWPPASGTKIPKLARSACECHQEWIEAQVTLGRNAMAIYQDLVELFGFSHRYNSVKRFVQHLKEQDPERYDRLEFLMGEEAQVDYGQGALTLHPSGKYRRPRLFVMTLKYSGRLPPNLPPTVNAGPDQTITLPDKAMLAGTVSDDGQPPGGGLTSMWTKVSGPGTVTFSNPAAAATEASFSTAGTYVLRLTASDSLLFSSDDVTITVLPQNFPPTVNAGSDQTITLPASAQLNGSANDDGSPQGSSLVVTWSLLSGPGDVVFADSHNAITTATMSAAGIYVLQLSATDGALTSNSSVTITVKPQAGESIPPDPATVAPPLDPTVATTMEDAVKFLYTGANPIQRGVDPVVMNPIRLAVVKGKVFERSGAPLSGVKITILSHPEFGHTLSRLDGGYDMAVNGGGRLVVNMEKDGYLPVQRPADAPWQNYVLVDEARMVALETAADKAHTI